MENPYASPEPLQPTPPLTAPAFPQGPAGAKFRLRGMVGHVRVLGILMIVQGALDALMSLFVGIYTVMFGVMAAIEPMDKNRPSEMPAAVAIGLAVFFGLITLGIVVCAGLNIYAGIRLCRFRSRKLAMIAISANLATVLTVYCSVTAIGIFVYGLVVLLDNSVKEAIDLVENEGYTPDQVDVLFNPWAMQLMQPQMASVPTATASPVVDPPWPQQQDPP